MDRRQLMVAIVGGAALTLVGLGPMVVTADASPPMVSNEPDPSGPTFTIEPAPSAPSPDISSDTGITSSTDTGSGMPDESLPDLTVGAPSDLPPIVDVPSGTPPIEGTTGPADTPAPNAAGAPPNPAPGDPNRGTRTRPGSRVPPVLVPAPARRAKRASYLAVERSVLARHVRRRGSPRRSSCRRRAWCRHSRMLRLPRRCSTAARRSPPRLTAACGSGASGISATGSRCSDPNARREFRTTPPDFMIQSQSTLDRIVTQHRETLHSVFG